MSYYPAQSGLCDLIFAALLPLERSSAPLVNEGFVDIGARDPGDRSLTCLSSLRLR